MRINPLELGLGFAVTLSAGFNMTIGSQRAGYELFYVLKNKPVEQLSNIDGGLGLYMVGLLAYFGGIYFMAKSIIESNKSS